MPCELSLREETLRSLEKLPKFSPALPQLLARFTHKNCDASTLAEVVAKDAVLSAQVLSRANSAILRRTQSIQSVKHAIAMIGVGAMRRFAIGCSVSNLFLRSRHAPSFSVMRFNLHSVATATLVELLADDLPVHHGQHAFLSGMLHDVGKMLIAVNQPKEYEHILELAAVTQMPLIECERQILGTDHAELSGIANSRWELPEPVQWAGFYHHEPENAPAGDGAVNKLPMSSVVNRADAFVNYLGMSILPPSGLCPEAPSLEFEGFQYDWERTLERFQLEWKRLGNLFH
jgi:HD-like signal output (HDOD) protein